MITAKQGVALVGFIALGLSPSFVDWQENPEKRPQIVAYYGAAIALIYLGLFRP